MCPTNQHGRDRTKPVSKKLSHQQRVPNDLLDVKSAERKVFIFQALWSTEQTPNLKISQTPVTHPFFSSSTILTYTSTSRASCDATNT